MNVLSLIPRVFFSGLRYRRSQAAIRATACAVLISVLSSPLLAANTIVRMETSKGGFNIELYNDDATATVNNFLDNYVTSGAYNNTVIHRSVRMNTHGIAVIQGGGFECCFFGYPIAIDTLQSIDDEINSHSNNRGTIAMALSSTLAGDAIPNSATSQWFINVADNSVALPNYTVFGQVLDSGMDVVDAIAALPTSTQDAYQKIDGVFRSISLNDFPKLGSGFVSVTRVCINTDGDGACPETEDLASGEDGNGDKISDRIQENVTTFLTSLNGVATLAADTDMRFPSVTAIDKDTALSWLKKFTSPPNQTLHFNNGTLRFTVVGALGADGKKTVTLHDGAATRPSYYYAYGPTLDNPTPHWYDFSYDGETGAEIKNDRIILHFVDNKRGDDNYTTNDSITHTGAQAVVTSTTTSDSPSSGGCSISANSKGALRAGDWMLVSLFLVFAALVRRRTRCSGRVGIAHRKQSDGGLCPPYI